MKDKDTRSEIVEPLYPGKEIVVNLGQTLRRF